jgi:hypothetical protein
MPICSPVIKRDAADFVLLLSSSRDELSLSLFETATGGLLKEATVESVGSAVALALREIRDHSAPTTSTPKRSSVGRATVYVYRYKQFIGRAIESSVYCDDAQLARMDNGRYFAVEVAPGTHVFRSSDPQSGIELRVEPGATYYLRVEIAIGLVKGHGRIVLVQSEQGSVEIKKLQRLGSAKVNACSAGTT